MHEGPQQARRLEKRSQITGKSPVQTLLKWYWTRKKAKPPNRPGAALRSKSRSLWLNWAASPCEDGCEREAESCWKNIWIYIHGDQEREYKMEWKLIFTWNNIERGNTVHLGSVHKSLRREGESREGGGWCVFSFCWGEDSRFSFFWEICNLLPLVSKGANNPVSVSGISFFRNFKPQVACFTKKMCRTML